MSKVKSTKKPATLKNVESEVIEEAKPEVKAPGKPIKTPAPKNTGSKGRKVTFNTNGDTAYFIQAIEYRGQLNLILELESGKVINMPINACQFIG